MGGVRALGLLLVAVIALFCLGISPSFVASAATTTEVCCAPVGKALGDGHGEALVRLDYDATSGLLTTPGEEVLEGEELSVRASLLMSMFVLAASSFFRSGLEDELAVPDVRVRRRPAGGRCGGVWKDAR